MPIVAILKSLAIDFVNPVASAWMTSITILLVCSILRRDPTRRRQDFFVAIGYATLSGIAIQLQYVVIHFTPRTMDAGFLRADRSMGFDPVRFASDLAHHRLIMLVLIVAYGMMPIMMITTWIIERSVKLCRAVVYGGVFCWVFYLAFPAVGPGWVSFHDPVIGSPPRNCFPSMHFAWALMLAINAKTKLKFFLWMYAGMIAVATIAIGEHYLIDLIAAVPFTLAMQILALYPVSKSAQKVDSIPQFVADPNLATTASRAH